MIQLFFLVGRVTAGISQKTCDQPSMSDEKICKSTNLTEGCLHAIITAEDPKGHREERKMKIFRVISIF